MNIAKTNEAFLLQLDSKTCNTITDNVANHYGITVDEALDEMCYNDEAHSIMDYVTGDIRPAVSLLFNKFKQNI